LSSLFVLDGFIPDDLRSRTLARAASTNTHADVKVNVARRALPADDCDMSVDTVIGIVGGTGLYDLPGLTDRAWRKIESPFGAPSDDVLVGRLAGRPIAFLPRHGRGHRIPPHEINFLANIDALKRAGATSLVSVSAVGSLRADLAPGTFVIVDQFVDRTLRRPKTFFGTGCVAHVPMAHPTCARLMDHLAAAGGELGLAIVRGGTYVAMEGPQFSTLAESELHRGLRCDVVGMTNMPEAKLAREAELCYATVAMVTDFDCWHPDHDDVNVEDVIRVLHANSARARELIARVVPRIGAEPATCPHGCDRTLDAAIVTAPEARDPELVRRLDAIAGRVLGRAAGS
jgi:5'-methylthioadenosine phosphorylase